MTLHQQFVQLGKARNQLTYQLLQLLPEIFKQKIYIKYAATIEEYAGKFAGISNAVVKKRLNLEKHLENKPNLKKAIATVGMHKVAIIATAATPKNEKQLAKDLKNMSKAAIQELSKEIRGNTNSISENSASIEIDGETLFLFKKLKKKLGNNISNKEALRRIIKKLAESEIPEPTKKKTKKSIPSRYISKTISAATLAQTSGRCAYPTCQRSAEHFHHRERFADKKSHDSIIPICKIHHEFAHNNLIKNELDDPSSWKIDIINRKSSWADEQYRKKRMEVLI